MITLLNSSGLSCPPSAMLKFPSLLFPVVLLCMIGLADVVSAAASIYEDYGPLAYSLEFASPVSLLGWRYAFSTRAAAMTAGKAACSAKPTCIGVLVAKGDYH